MLSAYDFAALKAEGKVALTMSSGFLGLGDFPESFSGLKRLTGLSDPALAKALKKLLQGKVIERTPEGTYKLRGGQREQLAACLQPFVGECFREKAAQVAEELAKFDDVIAVIIYGSTAQGKATPDSDVDLLIVVKDRDSSLERRIDELISRMCIRLDIPFEHVFISLEGLKAVVERELLLLFGLMERYQCLLDRGNVRALLQAKETEIRDRYEYDGEVHLWLPRK